MKWMQFGGKNSPDAVKKLKQEYPTTAEEAFLSSGQNYFSVAKTSSLLSKTERGKRGEIFKNDKGNCEFREMSNGDLEVFKKPEVGHKYIIGGDTAEGLVYGDWQVLYVIDHNTEECAALFRSHIAPDELATAAYNLGKFYNWAMLAIEVNKDGLWVNDSLEKMGYVNLYYRKVFDDISQKITKYFGWKTTSATRPFALTALRSVHVRKDCGFPAQLLNEMFSFIRNARGKPEALSGKNDDVIMAAAIGYSVLQEIGKYVTDKQPGQGENLMKRMFGEKQ
jgi:hypothetical protein